MGLKNWQIYNITIEQRMKFRNRFIKTRGRIFKRK